MYCSVRDCMVAIDEFASPIEGMRHLKVDAAEIELSRDFEVFAMDSKEKIVVGVNDFVEENESIDIPILEVSPEVERMQRKRLAEVRQCRNAAQVQASLEALRQAGVDGANMMPKLLDCTRAYVTLGEMCSALAEVFGTYEEQAVF